MNRPNISIIIPVFNVAQYLPACLDSALEQTIDDLEIICINDASPDNSNDILKRYASTNPCITIYQHAVNRGQSAARNTGIAAARGKFIFFLDPDDMLFSPTSLLSLYKLAKQDMADEVIGATLRWEEKTGERQFGYHKVYLKDNVNGVRFKEAQFLASNVIGCNKLIRTTLLKEHDIQFPADLSKFEDNPFSWKVHLRAKSISVCPQPTYLHRLRDSSSSQSIMQVKKNDYVHHVRAADNFLLFLEQNRDLDDVRHIFEKYFVLWLQQDLYSMIEEQLTEYGKDKIFEAYHSILSRIPQSSLLYFSARDALLIQLMGDKKYTLVWEQIRYGEHQVSDSEKIKKIQNQLNNVYNSTSWRLTAPYRFVAEKIKFICRKCA